MKKKKNKPEPRKEPTSGDLDFKPTDEEQPQKQPEEQPQEPVNWRSKRLQKGT